MRSTSVAILTIALALAASVAFAQVCATPQPPPAATAQPPAGAGPFCTPGATFAAPQPAVGAGPMCAPVQQPTYMPAQPGAGPYCVPGMAFGPAPGISPSISAGLGAGPALTGLCGPNFDVSYVTSMYQLHTNISALATQGVEQSTSRDLVNLSAKIRNEQVRQNQVLAAMYRDMGLGKIPVDFSTAQSAVNTLTAYNGTNFDTQYALEMATLLGQQRNAALLAETSTTNPRLRDQARIEAKTSTDEINALQRWIGATAISPAGAGAGPGYQGVYTAPGGTIPIY